MQQNGRKSTEIIAVWNVELGLNEDERNGKQIRRVKCVVEHDCVRVNSIQEAFLLDEI